MGVLIASLMVILAVGACSQEDDPAARHGKEAACEAEQADINASLDALNYCSTDTDCQVSGVNPHYGCYAFHHKDADIAPVTARIDAYSDSECWDGMTTLTTLDCATVPDLVCTAGKCGGMPAGSGALGPDADE